jgi:lysozyme family protein
MSHAFFLALAILLNGEGFYSNDVRDPGGETIWGIDRKNNSTWIGWQIIDSFKTNPNFPACLETNQALIDSRNQFYIGLWNRLHCEEISAISQTQANQLFYSANNQGESLSIKWMQEILDVKVDGVMGLDTITAYKSADPERVLRIFAHCRRSQYALNVRANENLAIYLNGWLDTVVSA